MMNQYQNEILIYNDCLYRNMYRFVFPSLAALAALYLPSSLTDWLTDCSGLHNLLQHSLHNLCRPYQTIPTKPEFLPYFIISTKFHNFGQISEFWPNFTISAKFHNFNQISQLPPMQTLQTMQTMQTIQGGIFGARKGKGSSLTNTKIVIRSILHLVGREGLLARSQRLCVSSCMPRNCFSWLLKSSLSFSLSFFVSWV